MHNNSISQHQDTKQDKTILVVDDSLTTRMQVKKLLENNNFKVILAENGEKCLEILNNVIPCAILLDIVMPGIDGIDVCKKIKADKKYENVPILILTTEENIENKVNGLDAGADDYLTKPFEIEELLARLNAVLRTKELYEELKAANHRIMAQQKSVIEEERLNVLLQMAGATAHELNQPLMILLGNIELMQDNMGEPELLVKCMSSVTQAGHRISDIVKKIETVREVELKTYIGDSKIINLHQKIKILSVDNADKNFEKIREILQHHDQIYLTHIKSIKECFEELKQNKYNLILLSHHLPDSDLFDCLGTIEKQWASIPVIMCTGYEDEVLASRAIQAGASDYIPEAEINETSLLNVIKNTLENARLKNEIKVAQKKIIQMSSTDELTQLYNRRYFMEAAEIEVVRARRYETGLFFCMMDIDCFRKINDTYGKPAGDAVLKNLGKLFKKSIRETDLICRYGGDKFCMILICINAEKAINVCERFRKTVSQYRTRYESSEIQVTISIGISFFDPLNPKIQNAGQVTHHELIKYADKKLYQAKKNGKNQVQLYMF